MFVNHQKLIHLPVFTESGTKLGHIYDLEIDIETHHVRKYMVGPRFMGKETYLINPAQIKSITADKIIVEDTITKTPEPAKKKVGIPPALDTPLTPSVDNIGTKA